MQKITCMGIKTHNLKNIDIELPRDKLIVIDVYKGDMTCIAGVSGSCKSSLVFSTI